MMILFAFAAGFAVGWFRAANRGGNRLDKLQYGAAHAIAFAILALVLVIIAGRSGLV